MTSISRNLVRGALAGAAGTTALNTGTFVDMALRARPASSTPEQTAERGVELVSLSLSDDEEQKQARGSGLGSRLGSLAGVGAASRSVAYALSPVDPAAPSARWGPPGCWRCSPETGR
jgi:hypothetical protein